MKSRGSFVLPPTGTAFKAVGGNVFEKDVLVEGEYQHPINPWDDPLRATHEYIDRICANTNAAIKAGQRVYVPDGHSNKAKDNTGFSQEFVSRFEDGKWRAKARIEIEDPAYVSKMGTTIKDVSPLIVNYPLGDGKDLGERIAHVALVPDPVMPGQGNFVACSVTPGTLDTVDVPVLRPVSQEPPAMKIKVTADNMKALSLSGTEVKVGDEVEVTVVEKALSVAHAKVEAAVTAQTVAEKALADERAIPKPTVEKMLSVDVKNAPYFVEARTSRKLALNAVLDAAQSKGKINAAMRTAFEKVLSVRHGYALSEAGVAEIVDVAATAESILATIPDDAAVPIGERIARKGADGSGRPPNEPAAFDAKTQADKILEAGGFKKPAPVVPVK